VEGNRHENPRAQEPPRTPQHVEDLQEREAHVRRRGAEPPQARQVGLAHAHAPPGRGTRDPVHAKVQVGIEHPGRGIESSERALETGAQAEERSGRLLSEQAPQGGGSEGCGRHALPVDGVERAGRVAEDDQPLGPIAQPLVVSLDVLGGAREPDGRERLELPDGLVDHGAPQRSRVFEEARLVGRRLITSASDEREKGAPVLDREHGGPASERWRGGLDERAPKPVGQRRRAPIEPARVADVGIDDALERLGPPQAL